MTPSLAEAIDIIVPVFGRFELLDRCLASLASNSTRTLNVTVVDDASPGGPPDLVAQRGSFASISLVERLSNGGFAHAVNDGIRRGSSKLVAVINSDAFVAPGWDTALASALDERTGIAAAVQVSVDGEVHDAGLVVGDDGNIAVLTSAPAAAVQPVQAVGAACVMMRRRDLAMVGGFSTAFGAGYYEDVDLCLALRRLGLRSVVVAEATVVHQANASFGLETATRRSSVGRHTINRRRWWDLRDRVPVHRWELLAHRERFAAASGRAGRVIVLESGLAASLQEPLDALDIAVVAIDSDHALLAAPDLQHWADAVVGCRETFAVSADLLAKNQPRAALVDADDDGDVVTELEFLGLGRRTHASWDTGPEPGEARRRVGSGSGGSGSV